MGYSVNLFVFGDAVKTWRGAAGHGCFHLMAGMPASSVCLHCLDLISPFISLAVCQAKQEDRHR